MTVKRILASVLAITMTLCLTACEGGSSSSDGSASIGVSSSLTDSSSSGQTDSSSGGSDDSGESDSDILEAVSFTAEGAEVTDIRFLSAFTDVTISAPEGATVYYTTDGSIPSCESEVYSEPIEIKPCFGDFPTCLLLRAKAVFQDGSESEVVTHTFFASFDINTRFSNPVFSITGDPNDLFNKPDGIFYGKNYELRGRESEREVYVEAINSRGELIFEQGAGVRIFGAASRESSIKSLKLFARKAYEQGKGKFDINVFGTPSSSGEAIEKYDKLVLRNAGNDFQFAFIRDELNQRLAAQAGYTDCEGVLPAVVYLNGNYYGLLWLHETFCDDLLKDKYGGETGNYEVIEGKETEKKTDDDDEATAAAANEFNDLYNKLAYSDLTDEANYSELCSLIDVENYLDNYAYNIYVNNYDWPQNNYKCYRYYAAEGEEYGSGHADGRWRFLLHDTDYCMGLYEQDVTAAGYNNIKHIMTENDERYSPLFTNLMARQDCREYFLAKITELMNGVLSSENISQTLESMNKERYSEMQKYYSHLENLKRKDDSIWSWYDNYLKQTEMVRSFAKSRAGYVKKYLISQFELPEDYFD